MRFFRFLILFPFLVGLLAILALFVQSREAGTIAEAFSDLRRVIYMAGGVTFLGAIVFSLPHLGRRSRGAREYQKPKIVSASMIVANLGRGSRFYGELKVRASHSSHISKEIPLPAGSRIQTIDRGLFFRVLINSSDPADLVAIARANGYQGKINGG